MYRFALRRSYVISRKNELCLFCSKRTASGYNAPREAGFGKFLVILSPLIATGGVVAYAKYDEDFRKSLVKTIPAIEPALNFLLQDEKVINKKIEETKSSVMNLFGQDSKKKIDEVPPPLVKKKVAPEPTTTQQTKSNDIKNSAPASIPVPAPTPPNKPTTNSTEPPKSNENKTESPTVATKTIPIAVPNTFTELEKAIDIAATIAIEEYNKAIKVLKHYNEEVKKIVDESLEKIDTTSWVSLKNRTNAINTAVKSAEDAAQEAKNSLEKLEKSLNDNIVGASQEVLEITKKKIANVKEHLGNAKVELLKSKELSDLSEKYWKKVENARNYFVEELESIFPGINFSEKQLNFSKEDLNLFMLYAHSHVLAYQKELQKLQIEGELRLKRAFDSLNADDNQEALKAQLDYLLEKEKSELAMENQKKLLKLQIDAENKIRSSLKRQSEAHVDHLNEALKLKEDEMKRTFSREMDEKLATEQTSYKIQLATMLGKLKGMDAALQARADADKCAHQAQALWSACQALWLCLREGQPGVSWSERLRPLENEVKTVGKAAAESDEFVQVVLEALPSEARDRGVYPEDALRERFLKVDRLARRVALVPEAGARLPVYILSYLQSILIMTPDNPISKEELKDEVVDFKKLDTYDILNRARYWLDRGNLTQTLKYMNLLEGAPRKVARDWLKEARLLLETQLVVNTLMTHAAASGLLYL